MKIATHFDRRLFPSRISPALIGTALIACLLGTVPGHAESADEPIGRIAERYVASGDVPGVIIAISRPGSGTTVIRRGVADLSSRAPMNPENSQRIGSITKSFTVTRILQLADQGRLSLNDPIDQYVPGLKNSSATLRQLADMTSGIFNYTEDEPFILDFAFHRTKVWTDRQLVAVANSHQPYFAPGKGWYYSNTNTVLLGMVVERVTGRPLGGEITRKLIRPLGLNHTLFPTGIYLPSPFNHGYATLDSDVGPLDVSETSPSGSAGSGAMISTLDDLRIWGRALARGSAIGRLGQLARLRMVDSSQGIGPYYDRYGLGMGKIDGWLGHTADIFGYQSLVMHNLVANETVVIFVNASNREHIPTEIFQQMTPLLASAYPNGPTELRVTGKSARSTTRSTVTLRGRATSDAGILLVDSSVNGKSHRLARGSSPWRLTTSLRPGRNVIRIRAVDRLNRTSRPTRIIINRT